MKRKKGKELLHLQLKINRKFMEREEVRSYLNGLPPDAVEFEKECLEGCLLRQYKLSDLSLVFQIHEHLLKEANELKYGVPFLHCNVMKNDKGRSFLTIVEEKIRYFF